MNVIFTQQPLELEGSGYARGRGQSTRDVGLDNSRRIDGWS